MAKRTNGVKSVRTQQHYDLTDKRPITSRLKVLSETPTLPIKVTTSLIVETSATVLRSPRPHAPSTYKNTVLTPGFKPSRKRLYMTILTGA